MSELNRVELIEVISEKIAEIAELDDPSELEPSSHLVKDLELDSMELLELLTALETEYDLSLPESDFEKMTTIDACAEVVLRAAGRRG